MPYTPRSRFALTTLALAFTFSCTTPVASEGMVPDNVKVARQHATTVQVHAQDSPSGWASSPRIDGDALGEAIQIAIADCGVFTVATPEEESAPEYTIEASITKLHESGISLDMSAELEMCWQLVPEDGSEPVWESQYTTTHVANTFDAETTDERLMIAIEGAVQKNVAQALRDMSTIRFESPAEPAQTEAVSESESPTSK